MLFVKQKYFLFFTVIFGIYFFINIPLIRNCIFLADDLPIIFFSVKTPFTLFTYWENGLQELLPSTHFDSFRYRPLTSFVFYLTAFLFDLKPSLWAIASQINHLLNFALLVFILKKIQTFFDFKSNLFFIIPVFYLFYPGNVTNLAWASGRIDLMVIFFCLTSFSFSLYYIQNKKFIFLILSSALFLLGCLTKENALSWFAVEFFLLWQIYFLYNKPPQLFTSLVKLLNAKLAAGVVYVFLRSTMAMINDKSVFDSLKSFDTAIAYLKSLFFTFLPVDSGTFIYSFASSGIIFSLLYLVYFSSISFVIVMLISKKDFYKIIFSLLSISFVTLAFYSIAGGGTYRLFVLTFTSLLISFFILLCAKLKDKKNLNRNMVTASIVIFIFFVYGFNKISDYWIINYKLQDTSISSLVTVYDKDKENIILSYPHTLGQAYCYSDAGIYLYYKMNNKIGRLNNITELAAINSVNAEHYTAGSTISRENNSFIVSSQYDDTYFSPGAFFTEKSILGQKYSTLKYFSFEVLKLNRFSKPLTVKFEAFSKFEQPYNFIRFTDGKFEKF